jgi:hypothetical protein
MRKYVIAAILDVHPIAPNFGVCLNETRHSANEKQRGRTAQKLQKSGTVWAMK